MMALGVELKASRYVPGTLTQLLC